MNLETEIIQPQKNGRDHQWEIKNAHKAALYSEKVASKLSEQAIGMVNNGQQTAEAKQTFGHRVRLVASYPDLLHDVHTIELAANAALKPEGVKVKIIEGPADNQVDVYSPDTIKIVDSSSEKLNN